MHDTTALSTREIQVFVILSKLAERRGHDLCHHEPEAIEQLMKLYDVRPPGDLLLPELWEFQQGCRDYQVKLFGSTAKPYQLSFVSLMFMTWTLLGVLLSVWFCYAHKWFVMLGINNHDVRHILYCGLPMIVLAAFVSYIEFMVRWAFGVRRVFRALWNWRRLPADWQTYHHAQCGTRFRDCHPTLCPKTHFQRMGEWKPELRDDT